MTLSREPPHLALPISDRDRCLGDPAARVTLVQYGDYQCPACQTAHGVILTIQQQLGNHIWFAFRHFPQPDIHPEACHAAEAAEAAAAQNQFWEMHTHLLARQSQLADHYLVEYALALQLDVEQFLQEMSGDYHVARVKADIQSGIQSGVTKTPTFFINGLKYQNEPCLEALLEAVLQAYDG